MRTGLKSLIYSYWVKRHGAFEYRNGWMRVPVCPFCGREEKFGIHISQNVTNCFVCGSHGDIVSCIKEIEGDYSLQRILDMYKGLEYTPKKYTPIPEKDILLPESYINISFGESPYAMKARKYLIKRNFSIELLSKKGIGYIIDSESEYYNHIIIPYFKDNKLIYFQARRFDGFGPKYNNPKLEDVGVHKGHIIYNHDSIGKYPEMNILEGVFNALTLGDNSIAIGSKFISSYQLSIIHKSNVLHWNIILDSDAWEYAFKIAFNIIGSCKSLRVVLLETEEDPNDLGSELTQYWINQAPIITQYQELIKWRNYAKNRQRELLQSI